MTVLLTAAFHDAVILVADGRVGNAFHVKDDNSQKLIPLGENFVLGLSGAELATDMAVQNLRTASFRSAEQWESALTAQALGCGQALINLVIPATLNDRMKIGLLAGGIDAQGTYIVGAIYGYGMEKPNSLLNRVVSGGMRYQMVGGESIGSSSIFESLVQPCLSDADLSAPTTTELHEQIIASAAETIRRVAQADQGVGGRIHFHVLRKGQTPRTGAFAAVPPAPKRYNLGQIAPPLTMPPVKYTIFKKPPIS